MSEIKSLLKVLEPIITEPLIQEDLKFESPSVYLFYEMLQYKQGLSTVAVVSNWSSTSKTKVWINLATGL